MRIVLFVVDDIEFVSELNKELIEKYKEDIVQVYVSKSLFSFKKLKKTFSFFLKNRYPFCIKFRDLFKFILWKLRLIAKGKDGFKNIMDYYQSLNLKVEYIEDIKGVEILNKLRDLDADIFLFSPFDKIAGPKFISIPKLGAFNVHLGKLPEYKGGLSAFWVLRYGESTAGASLHRIIPKLDEGELIEEVRFKYNTNSMHELMHQTVKHASKMIVEALEKLKSKTNKPISIHGRSEGYYLYPTKLDFKEFYKKNNKLI